ncbi:epimerase family protein SDR39U1-like isoform X2 [Stylophora pistillata]|uniref:Epimerase family protein SDR39U1 n=1 Tax=Stylophora pistillata TaxID=50429 RepID=A0A2B4STM5_STYPI|nr:epimerase family protein SDR39U1-like isoform X2 [Stylophora pistillata]PFX32230.1 Epimerase family protein SDR39U1 [Stylophora pistillata]
MRVLVGGGTGFIGRALVEALKRKGHEVTIISRSQAPGKITWSEIAKLPLPECEAVVNLAGENILNPLKRWNEGFLQTLRDSRIETTKTLAKKISEASNPPKVFVSSSAVGYYPPSDTAEYTEDSPPSSADALTTLCADWEKSAKLPDGCKTRLVTLRIGVVLGRGGGVIQQTIWPFWFGLGGVLGSGKQYFPWIHVDDMTGIIFHALENDHVTGVLNAVAPQVVTNESYTKEYAGALWRPAILPTPSFAVNFIFGQDRGKILLEGQKVIPKRTLEMGYKFQYPELKQALAEIVK